jgi:hypothetical protein
MELGSSNSLTIALEPILELVLYTDGRRGGYCVYACRMVCLLWFTQVVTRPGVRMEVQISSTDWPNSPIAAFSCILLFHRAASNVSP